jgi:hypothetical protein
VQSNVRDIVAVRLLSLLAVVVVVLVVVLRGSAVLVALVAVAVLAIVVVGANKIVDTVLRTHWVLPGSMDRPTHAWHTVQRDTKSMAIQSTVRHCWPSTSSYRCMLLLSMRAGHHETVYPSCKYLANSSKASCDWRSMVMIVAVVQVVVVAAAAAVLRYTSE